MKQSKMYSFKEVLEILIKTNKDIVIVPNYGKALPKIKDKEITVNGMNVKGVDKVILTKTDCDIGNNQKYHNLICKILNEKNEIITYKVLNKNSSFTYQKGVFGDEVVID